MPQHKTRTSIKPGEVRNPKGRPVQGYSITDWFKNMLNSSPEEKDRLGKAIMDKALKGDPTAQKLVWNYMDGMPKQSLDVQGKIEYNNVVELPTKRPLETPPKTNRGT